ncbi:hypothetical protein [Mycobacteroides abscessus]
MSDPSIEAAQRAWHANSDNDGGDPQLGFDDRRVWDTAVSAAREMAKSVQELHKRVVAAVWWHIDPEDPTVYIQCSCGSEWPCETAKRVYPSEELGL